MILTKIITTAKAELLIIGGLPEILRVVKITGIEDLGLRYIEYPDSTGCTKVPINISGDWQPVGFLKDLNEDDAEKFVVHYAWEDTPDGERWAFKDYITGEETDNYEDMYPYDTAKESLLSLIQSEVKLKNKFGEFPDKHNTGLNYGMEYIGKVQEWEAEQETVFTNPFIMIKNSKP